MQHKTEFFAVDPNHAAALAAQPSERHVPDSVPTGTRYASRGHNGSCVVTGIVGADWDPRARVIAGPFAQGTVAEEADAAWETAREWVRSQGEMGK